MQQIKGSPPSASIVRKQSKYSLKALMREKRERELDKALLKSDLSKGRSNSTSSPSNISGDSFDSY